MQFVAEHWTIERLVPGGEGFCRLTDGRVGFAPGTAPGDRIRVEQREERRSFVRATRWELVEAGPDRVEPHCTGAAQCGGCDMMHLSRPAQLEAKRGLLVEAFHRTGGIREPRVGEELVCAGPALGYRSRARFHVAENGEVGFHARGSHEVVAANHCAVCRDTLNEALGWLATAPVSVRRELSEVELREALGGGPLLVRLVLRSGPLSPAAARWFEQAGERYAVEVANGQSSAVQHLPLPGELQLVAFGDSFTQVNWPVNTALVRAVVEGAQARGVKSFLDLYCGAGNFTLPLLGQGLEGVAVERDARAIEAARAGAQLAGLSDEGFIAGNAVHVARRFVRKKRSFDLVILDPPRAGAREVIELVAKLAARFVAMCACDPVTLARDTKSLVKAGFELEQVTGFDMFPQTHHLEALAWLKRPSTL